MMDSHFSCNFRLRSEACNRKNCDLSTFVLRERLITMVYGVEIAARGSSLLKEARSVGLDG